MTGVVAITAYVLAGLTVARAVGAVRRKEARPWVDVDILLFVVAVPLPRFLRGLPPDLIFLERAVLWGQCLLALRLVAAFRPVSSLAWAGALAGFALLVIGAAIMNPASTSVPGAAYMVTVFLLVSAAFATEMRLTSGVSRARLAFASGGAAAIPVAFGTVVVDQMLGAPGVEHSLASVSALSSQIALICFYFAFATPQWLRARWQRTEQARYLSATTEQDVETRAARAAVDLNAAAARAVSHSTTFVALAEAPGGPDARLTVRASTAEDLVDRPIDGDGVCSRVWRTDETRDAPIAAVEPALAGRLQRVGRRVLVAPVAASTHAWGVIGAVQRRGSLFPEDDLRLLRQFGRYAAIALDHGALVAEAKARERRAAERRLREFEERMSLMLDSIKDYAMLVVDGRGRVVNWHVGAQHVFGYTPAEMADEPAAPLYALTQDDFLALLDEAGTLGLASREGPCRRKDGARFIGHTTVRPLDAAADGLVGFVAVTRDVSEQHALEERLRQSQKMEAIGRLAGGIAHDFNNLLTTIMGQSQWLEREVPASDPRRLLVDEIRGAAERAAGLTRQLLAFSRGQMLQPVVLNLRRVVEELLPMLRRMISERITVEGRWDTALAPVMGDRSQIEQVLLNLAVNARDAMPAGGRLTVTVGEGWVDEAAAAGEVPAGDYVWVEVQDTGVGMDEETRSRIFEPFFTTKAFGEGTGFGLATVYGIAKQMSGFVRVSSEPGRGTTFRVHFPRAVPVEEDATEEVDLFETLRGTETILVVEDDASVRTFVAQTLRRFGYQTLAAEHRDAALALAQAHVEPIHLVVTDVVMPDGTGPELARALADIRPGVPVLYISGYADAVLSRAAVTPKASHFLQKPFTATDLLMRVKQLLSTPA